MIAINAAMANQLNEFKVSIDKLMEEGVGKDEAIFRIMKETIIASEPIRFEGDGYSEQWKQEAARRGLTNICHVPEALMHYMDNQSRSVLIGERIFNETELACRLEVELEKYTMKVQIESRVLAILPSTTSYRLPLSTKTVCWKISVACARPSLPKNTKSSVPTGKSLYAKFPSA